MNEAISVILPNYNGQGLLEKNLPSIITALSGLKYEIIVVDDCSSDNSVKFLEQEYPEVIIKRNSSNLGFSATCNIGIHASRYPILCLSNTDVTFAEDYFINALTHFNSPDVFAVKGNINNYIGSIENTTNTERTSLMYFSRGFLRFDQRIEPQSNTFTGQINGQFILLGCCFICKKDKMLLLDGFDEIFSPFYWEDADLAIRALRKGFRLVYEPKCDVYHETSSTISKYSKNTKRRLISNRNKFIFTWKHLNNSKYWFLHIFFTFINIFTRWIILDWKYYVSLIMATGRIFKYKFKTNEKYES